MSEHKGVVPGLLKGLATTARTMTRHTSTQEYPDVRPELPPRSRGVIALLAEAERIIRGLDATPGSELGLLIARLRADLAGAVLQPETG